MFHPVIVEQRDPKTDQHHENQKLKKIFHQLTCEKVCPCLSTIKSRKRRFSGQSNPGSFSNSSSAAWRAFRIKTASRLRSPSFSSGNPLWAVPRRSPGPRSSQSASAISKPLVVFSSTDSFVLVSVDLSELTSQQCDVYAPRPIRPRN